MRAPLARLLLDVHLLLRDEGRERGTRPGLGLEEDIEDLAHWRGLHTERRVRQGPHGAVYYSGLTPETDLFVYDGPQFLQVEAKDLTGCVGRAIPTEFWARALDLHLGKACHSLPEQSHEHYVALVAAGRSSDELRAACLRWGIFLVEPCRVPLVSLVEAGPETNDLLARAGCSRDEFRWSCLSFNDRFPMDSFGVFLPFGRFRSQSSVAAVLRFQRLMTDALASGVQGLNASSLRP